MFSRRTFQSLQKADQDLVMKVGRETQLEQRELWDAYTKEAITKLQASGVTFVKDVDKKAFQDAVKPVWDKYGTKYAALVKRIEDVR